MASEKLELLDKLVGESGSSVIFRGPGWELGLFQKLLSLFLSLKRFLAIGLWDNFLKDANRQ